MANRGESKSQKSISAPKARYFLRKKNVFTAKTRAGPHSKKTSVPMSFVLRELLEVASNLKEAKRVLSKGKIKVNGTMRKDARFNVGLFDMLELTPEKKKYRIVLDKKGRLVLKEIDFKSKDFKVSKVTSKRKMKNGKVMATTNDGFTIELGKEKVNVDDSVRISLPSLKIEEVYPLEKGNTVFIIGGTHVGEQSHVESVTHGEIQRKKLVSLKADEKSFQTITKNVLVVGKGKSEIEALEAK